ncbi:endonuclease III [Candidatus Micrarchaeota archaeon]|nr:endonuclease III [Candidatus Micrarchaeota archaeon]
MKMDKKTLAGKTIELLFENKGALSFLGRQRKESKGAQALAFRVLISTILSHWTKDAAMEAATNKLLTKYPTPEKLSGASVEKIAELSYPVGFYKTKAGYIKKTSRQLLKEFNGRVPNTMEELTSLPGVGRKTASCVLNYAFSLPAIAVDTHVHRISNRIGLVKTKTPEQTEVELKKIVPKQKWMTVNELLVVHGQTICWPIKPNCKKCPLNKICKSAFKA